MKKLPIISLENKIHRGSLQLFLYFSFNKEFIQIVKHQLKANWSVTLRAWYLPLTLNNINKVKTTFKDLAIINDNILPSSVKQYRKNRRVLSSQHQKVHKEYILYLKGKRYSKSTIDTYSSFISEFLGFIDNKPLLEVNNKIVEQFIETDFINKRYSISTQRQFISALKLFIKFYPFTQISNLVLERPKKDKKLPLVLSKEEVIRLIKCTRNIKHKVIIALIYSAGLRISELIQLKLVDFNIERRQLIIKNSKGRKDRYVVLAESILPLLFSYVDAYQPKKYFVEGPNGCYSASSVRKFLEVSSEKARILKKVTPHTLRHSYATHLLENGTGIRHIQELLGHSKPETTMIYTHVAKKDLLDIESPLDGLMKTPQNTTKNIKNLSLSGKNNI